MKDLPVTIGEVEPKAVFQYRTIHWDAFDFERVLSLLAENKNSIHAVYLSASENLLRKKWLPEDIIWFIEQVKNGNLNRRTDEYFTEIISRVPCNQQANPCQNC